MLIVEHGHPQAVTNGEFLFTEGDPPAHVYAVLSGRIHIVRTLRSGRQLLLGMKGPIEHFGELSALDGAPRAAAAIAAERSVVARLSAHRFVDLLAAHPNLAISITYSLAAQLREANERLCARTSERTIVRAGHQLAELAMLYVKHNGHSNRVELTITQRDLADWIGATREATARSLGQLRRAGVVETARGRIIVSDVQGLAELVNSLEPA
jgi:CRP-like cAMP-binding protein